MMQFRSSLLLPAALMFLAVVLLAAGAKAAPMSSQPNFYNELESDPDPEVVLEMLARLGQSLIRARENANSKRGMDLGLSRGYSGSMAAKHLMGLASANYAGGPGRKRRDAALA